MRINKVKIKNFRLLKDVDLTLEQKTTVIVGRNNSGKTSFTEVFRRLLSDNTPRFNLEDFSISVQDDFWNAFILMKQGKEDLEIREILPFIEVTLSLNYDIETDDFGPLSEFIVDLNPSSTEVIANIKYQLKDGKINSFFENLHFSGESDKLADEKKNFFRMMKERVPQLYSAYIYAIDPGDDTNQKAIDISKFRTLLQTGFINAQRGLDDTTHRDSEVLGKVVERMLDIAKTETASPEDNQTASALEEAVKDIQEKLDTDFNEHLNKLLPALSLFGYPGLNNLPLHTETTLDVRRLLENHTKVRYPGINGINLPETYNGLGSRNLIYILFQLFEFFKSYKTQKTAPNFHLVFIEEPEAHLHPQMQEVFIRKLTEIADDFSKSFNNGSPWPIQFVITTHSTHIANEAPFEAIRYFLSTRYGEIYTRVKDLRKGFSSDSNNEEDKEFLHKYLTLTRCDLFFADKAILIEGPTERLLMPRMIKKIDATKPPEESLSSKYLSIVEVGGAYAHHFFAFLNFLELRTLIITDIDTVKPVVQSNGTYRNKCVVAEGTHTSNTCIKKWFGDNEITPEILINKSNEEKCNGFIRITYQVPETTDPASEEITNAINQVAATIISDIDMPDTDIMKASEGSETIEVVQESVLLQGPTGRSFEDSFMLANKDLFGIVGNTSIELAQDAWEKAKKIDKTNFALDYAINNTEWNVPTYLKDGLCWLAANPEVGAGDTPIDSTSTEVRTDE
ncbi:ATP-dependent endonuclease [Brevibacillus sp. MS2.2]|uniref:ATP-dependent nuclease n=1 Tax=Brevibacillus sp. MS2.2 TaxID=2738981 RepID=UPI00156A93DB|nr:ATP-dependent endonuclease [Brevibacillus sp. MS2.2]NRR22792.1 AAA family ATPase [Brevibacillus sp. MS2.2]